VSPVKQSGEINGARKPENNKNRFVDLCGIIRATISAIYLRHLFISICGVTGELMIVVLEVEKKMKNLINLKGQ